MNANPFFSPNLNCKIIVFFHNSLYFSNFNLYQIWFLDMLSSALSIMSRLCTCSNRLANYQSNLVFELKTGPSPILSHQTLVKNEMSLELVLCVLIPLSLLFILSAVSDSEVTDLAKCYWHHHFHCGGVRLLRWKVLCHHQFNICALCSTKYLVFITHNNVDSVF